MPFGVRWENDLAVVVDSGCVVSLLSFWFRFFFFSFYSIQIRFFVVGLQSMPMGHVRVLLHLETELVLDISVCVCGFGTRKHKINK